MARASKVDACMFCGEVPCICNAPAPKAKPEPKARAPRKKAEPRPLEKSVEKKPVASIHEAMKKAAKKKAWLPEEVQGALNDPELVSAIQAARILMGEEELEKWKPVFDKQLTAAERATVWKARNNEV